MPLAEQASSLLQALPAQQGWVRAPQATQLPPLHTSPAVAQVLPAQQSWSLAPQSTQLAPLHTVPAVHWLLAQQDWVSWPQAALESGLLVIVSPAPALPPAPFPPLPPTDWGASSPSPPSSAGVL